uniref:Uncharacterized protein n=1 Tax=Oryza nivara TaxID=4536 RepID=A0A0E0G666_ORYNI
MAMVALECGDDRAKGGVMSRLAESSRSRGHVAGRPVRRHLGARLSALPPLAAAASTATLGFEGGALQQGRRHCATMVMMALVPGGQEGREETSLRDPDAAAAAAAGSCTIVGSRQCRPLTSSVPRHPSPFTTVNGVDPLVNHFHHHPLDQAVVILKIAPQLLRLSSHVATTLEFLR